MPRSNIKKKQKPAAVTTNVESAALSQQRLRLTSAKCAIRKAETELRRQEEYYKNYSTETRRWRFLISSNCPMFDTKDRVVRFIQFPITYNGHYSHQLKFSDKEALTEKEAVRRVEDWLNGAPTERDWELAVKDGHFKQDDERPETRFELLGKLRKVTSLERNQDRPELHEHYEIKLKYD